MTKKKYPNNQTQLAQRDYNKNDDPRKPFWNESGFWDRQGKYRSGIPREERKREKCGAKTKKGECGNWAMKNGRCRLHGGKNVTKYHKKGADKVGDKESIWHSVLTEDETLFIADLKLDAEIMLNEELKLITVRERRMMERINDLIEAGEFTTVKKTRSSEVGTSGGMDLNKISQDEVAESTLLQIQKIEEALTKVQEKKAKLIELKMKTQEIDEEDNGALDGLVAILEKSKGRIEKEKKKVAKQLGED